MRVVFFPYTVVLLLILGCGPQPEAPTIDLEAERAALRKADNALSQTPNDVEQYMSFFTEGASFLSPDAPMTVGKDAIRAEVAKLFSTPGVHIGWEPAKVEVSKSGDLGYTIGHYKVTAPDGGGKPVTTLGKYVTVWEKQADGQWKVLADCFNADGPPAPQPE